MFVLYFGTLFLIIPKRFVYFRSRLTIYNIGIIDMRNLRAAISPTMIDMTDLRCTMTYANSFYSSLEI